MGVWQHSPAGIRIALTNDDLRVSFDAAPADWQPDDVVGSLYCVRSRVVDDHLVDEARSPVPGRRSRHAVWA
jgi:hypothetical protein